MDELEKHIASWSPEANRREHARWERRAQKIGRWCYWMIAAYALLRLFGWLLAR
jgi:hypothetical protein